MKWLLLGAVLGLLLVYPSLLTLAAAIVAAVASKPAAVAFVLGLLARPHLRRWVR
ncbi:hypothetical protein [Streptomyces sp. NPDC006333]|uniref:hypothetical protein n=1 Tax=Streptomyces sp. NPDC006333 TaxID=3156753 RepID=UPI0033ACB775